jgi:uncharacterized protein (TIGR00730 family)
MKVCVFCGSSTGLNPLYATAARELGSHMARSGITLVYGGGKVGLMGVIANAVIESGGEVFGVIPDFLMKREVGHLGITRLEVVESMHQRKQRMAQLADGFLALPGGWGTLEELAEILTWRQLGLIMQPIVILNINRFFDPILHQMRSMAEEGFLLDSYLQVLKVAYSPQEALALLYPEKG